MRYEAPSSLDQAVALLAAESGDARVLAGGTDLLVQLKTDLIEPVLVVDIKGIAETRQIKEEGVATCRAAVTGAETRAPPTQGRGRGGGGRQSDRSTQIPRTAPPWAATCATARRRPTRAGADRRRGQGVHRRPQGGGASLRGGCHASAAQSWRDQGRDRCVFLAAGRRGARVTPTCGSFRAPRWTLPWSAAACA